MFYASRATPPAAYPISTAQLNDARGLGIRSTWFRWVRRCAAGALMGFIWVSVANADSSTPTSTATSPKRDKSDEFFESGVVPQLHIEIASTNYVRLRSDPRNYVRATVREGDKVYEGVGVHLKGAAGSSRGVDDLPALTLNFDKFQEGQKFHGIDKLHLNNSVQDPSLMTEAICSDLFLAAGVPTARTTHARVWLNKRDLGIYVLKEGYDRTFLKRHFKNPRGNLYDGGFLHDINENLQRDEGGNDVANYADLRAVATACRERDLTKRMGKLEQVLDVDRFLSFMALEILTWHWDGYVLKHNNYRVYHDPDSGHCIFVPHGMDQMFWDAGKPFIPKSEEIQGLVAKAVLETGEGRKRYLHRVTSLVSNVFTPERLTNHLNQLDARLKPIAESIGPDRLKQHVDAVQHLRTEIAQRLKRVQEIASAPPPETPVFGPDGTSRLVHWRAFGSKTNSILDQPVVDGQKTLHIAANSERASASWRTTLQLPPGHYVFEARARSHEIAPLAKETTARGTGTGAGIRISQRNRDKGLVGDQDWQKLEFAIDITAEFEEPELICELRASKGEVWFDLNSLQLRRK